MGRYKLILGKEAKKHLLKIKKSGNSADMKKVERIFEELKEHPETGIGCFRPFKTGSRAKL